MQLCYFRLDSAAIATTQYAISRLKRKFANAIDVVIDATGVPAVGAEIGLRAMERGKHLVMMNSTFPISKKLRLFPSLMFTIIL